MNTPALRGMAERTGGAEHVYDAAGVWWWRVHRGGERSTRVAHARLPGHGPLLGRDAAGVGGGGLPCGEPVHADHGLVEGRRWALAAAFERWADLVHGVARQLVGHDHADDVTQQVFVEAWRSRRSFSPDRGEVPGWLVGITRTSWTPPLCSNR